MGNGMIQVPTTTLQPNLPVQARPVMTEPAPSELSVGAAAGIPVLPTDRVTFGKRQQQPQSYRQFMLGVAKVFGAHSAKKGFIVHKGWNIPGGRTFYKMRNGFRTPTKEERVDELTEKIWIKLLKPLMDNPAATQQMLRNWKAEFDAKAVAKQGKTAAAVADDKANPFAEHGATKGLEYLLQVFNPDGTVTLGKDSNSQKVWTREESTEKLKLMARMLALGYESGLEEKMAGLYTLSKTEAFQNANGMKRGQLSLEALGPVVLKFIQTLGNAPGVFPDELQEGIKPLYEDISPIPVEEVKNTIRTETGRSLDELFDQGSFREDTPKAGSIAQVHQAKLNGRKVAVKVVKNEAERTIEKDIGLLTPLVQMARELYPDYDLEEYMAEFQKLLRNECNMSSGTGHAGEAQVMEKCRELFKNDPRIVVPKIYPELTTRRVLTMDWLTGKSLKSYVGSGNKKVAAGFFSVNWDMIFKHGAFQADPHPGNMFYDAETDQFGFLDAGLVCFAPPREKMDEYKQFASVMPQDELLNFAKMLTTLFSRNLRAFADSMLEPMTPEIYKKLAGIDTGGLSAEEAAHNKVKGDRLKAEYTRRFGQAPNLADPDQQTLEKLNILHEEKVAGYVKLLNTNYPDVKSLKPKPILLFLKDAKLFAVDMGLETRYVNVLPWKSLFVAMNVARDIDPEMNLPMLLMNKMFHTFRENKELSFLVREGARLMGTELLDRTNFETLFDLTGQGIGKLGDTAKNWWRNRGSKK